MASGQTEGSGSTSAGGTCAPHSALHSLGWAFPDTCPRVCGPKKRLRPQGVLSMATGRQVSSLTAPTALVQHKAIFQDAKARPAPAGGHRTFGDQVHMVVSAVLKGLLPSLEGETGALRLVLPAGVGLDMGAPGGEP